MSSRAGWEQPPAFVGAQPLPTGFLSPDLSVGVELPGPRRFRKTRGTPSLVTELQAGHGFITAGTVGASNLNDVVDFALGTQSAWFQSNGAGATVWLKNSGMPNVDLTAKSVVLWVKVDDWTLVSSLQIQMGDTNFTNYFAAELASTAANVNENTRRLKGGEWARIVIPWSKFVTGGGVPNRATITCWQLRLVDKNTGVGAKVHWNGAGYIADGSSDWPNGVITITFDDALASAYTQGKSYMDKYGFPGTSYVIKDNIGLGGYMTLAQLKALQNYSGWEIAAHAYTQANHNAGFNTLTDAAVEQEIYESKAWLVANGFVGCDHFAWPEGNYNLTIEAIAARYFSTARLVDNVQAMTVPPVNPLRLTPRGYMQSTTAVATIEGFIDLTFANKDWLILTFHDIVAVTSAPNDYSIANFQTLIDYISTKGVPVRTIGDVMATYN